MCEVRPNPRAHSSAFTPCQRTSYFLCILLLCFFRFSIPPLSQHQHNGPDMFTLPGPLRRLSEWVFSVPTLNSSASYFFPSPLFTVLPSPPSFTGRSASVSHLSLLICIYDSLSLFCLPCSLVHSQHWYFLVAGPWNAKLY